LPCFWLIGHWFARVLVFLVFAVVGFIAGANDTPHNPAGLSETRSAAGRIGDHAVEPNCIASATVAASWSPNSARIALSGV
jgi:hypothetical protein